MSSKLALLVALSLVVTASGCSVLDNLIDSSETSRMEISSPEKVNIESSNKGEITLTFKNQTNGVAQFTIKSEVAPEAQDDIKVTRDGKKVDAVEAGDEETVRYTIERLSPNGVKAEVRFELYEGNEIGNSTMLHQSTTIVKSDPQLVKVE